MTSWLMLALLALLAAPASSQAEILSLRLAEVDSTRGYTEDGEISVLAGQDIIVETIGNQLDNRSVVKLTTAVMEPGEDCSRSQERLLQTKHLWLHHGENNKTRLTIAADDIIYSSDQDTYRICLKEGETFKYQGDVPELRIKLYRQLLPTWLMAVFVTFLLCLSGLFSGLNLGLMALDQRELQLIIKTGTETEQADAKAISPIRAMGNFLLCSLLLGNVLVNNSLTIMLDTLTGGGGLIAVIGSTLGIVVFGEIIPQALCSRHGLAVGAKTLFITKFFMLVTSPLSFPISKLLDWILGEELGAVYNRAKLLELLKQDDMDLNKDEVNILTGALVLQEKVVEDIMTPLADCFMLPLDSVLDFKTISLIKDKGYSRIPVYRTEETDVVHILLAKDLLFVDPDDKKPLEEICNFYKTPFCYIERKTHLNKMLDLFKTGGENGHLAIVKGDDEEAIGLVTLEDIIEEIIQAEIIDETDIVLDNVSRKKRNKRKGRFAKEKEFKMFMGGDSNKVKVSGQVIHAVVQFLSTSLPPFSSDNVSPDILQKLLNLDVFREYTFENSEEAKEKPILKMGRESRHFILIVEGKAEVQIGNEGYVFETGPFTSFGKQILELAVEEAKDEGKSRQDVVTWTPECTIVAKTDLLYLKLNKKTYKAALMAFKRVSEGSENENIEQQMQDLVQTQLSISDGEEIDPLI